MSPAISSLLLLAPLALYILHALWRLIASECLPAAFAFVGGYFICAILFRLTLPTLAVVPIWLPFLYPYAWTGIAALLLASGTLQVGRNGLRLDGVPPLLTAYALSQLCLHLGLITLSAVLADRPLQAYAMLPPLVAVSGYLLYRLCLQLSRRNEGWLSWPGVALTAVAAPLVLGWTAELLVPLLLRYI
ncbi:hypothetical protein [Vogesella sp. LIG4]|uniref:hypothetical protein n=1 Tax=Vogesella sp. LIG4 TaxID=1192162 RepID=UPI00081FC893|nr:hypothetical protein [Vogesella sp. LIG4]SCK23547.1 hypothetical protein PSELUDRAFT_2743 [Vogesella sp. LIG4]